MEPLFFGNTGLVDVAISNKLNQTEQRLLLLILGMSDKEGVCKVPMSLLSGALHLARPNVSRVVKGLVSQNIVTRLDEGNRGMGAKSYIFRFNPNPDTYAFNTPKEVQESVSDTLEPKPMVSPYQQQIDDLVKKYETERKERMAANISAEASKKKLDERDRLIIEKDIKIAKQEQMLRSKDEEFKKSIFQMSQELQELRKELNKPLLQKITDSFRRLFSRSKAKQ